MRALEGALARPWRGDANLIYQLPTLAVGSGCVGALPRPRIGIEECNRICKELQKQKQPLSSHQLLADWQSL